MVHESTISVPQASTLGDSSKHERPPVVISGGSTVVRHRSTPRHIPHACIVFAQNARLDGIACAGTSRLLQEDMPRRKRRSVAKPHRTLSVSPVTNPIDETVCVECLEAVDHDAVGEERIEGVLDLRLRRTVHRPPRPFYPHVRQKMEGTRRVLILIHCSSCTTRSSAILHCRFFRIQRWSSSSDFVRHVSPFLSSTLKWFSSSRRCTPSRVRPSCLHNHQIIL